MKRLMIYLFTSQGSVRLFLAFPVLGFILRKIRDKKLDGRICPSIYELDVFKGGREPYERLYLVRIPLYPGANGRRRIR